MQDHKVTLSGDDYVRMVEYQSEKLIQMELSLIAYKRTCGALQAELSTKQARCEELEGMINALPELVTPKIEVIESCEPSTPI